MFLGPEDFNLSFAIRFVRIEVKADQADLLFILSENPAFTNDTKPMSKLMLEILRAVDEFDPSPIKSCQIERIVDSESRLYGRNLLLKWIMNNQFDRKKQEGSILKVRPATVLKVAFLLHDDWRLMPFGPF